MAFNVRVALSGPNNLIEDFIKSMMKDCETSDDKFMLTGQELILGNCHPDVGLSWMMPSHTGSFDDCIFVPWMA